MENSLPYLPVSVAHLGGKDTWEDTGSLGFLVCWGESALAGMGVAVSCQWAVGCFLEEKSALRSPDGSPVSITGDSLW